MHALPIKDAAKLDVVLDNNGFTTRLLRELSGTLQEVIGIDEASGFISVVGQRMGEHIHEKYKEAWGQENLSRQQVVAVLVDLKRRIDGDFYVISEDEEKIVLGNRRCPFGDEVLNRPALCMMTSNVFGLIASENLGYAKVCIEEAIAQGDAGCRVVIYLSKTPEAEAAEGREYYRA